MENKLKSGSCEAIENEEIAVDLNEDGSLVFNVKGVEFKMIRVEGGEFMMGATAEQGDDAGDDEKPAHRVSLDSYYMGETLVTQALWKAVMGEIEWSFYEGENNPIELYRWNENQKFLKRLNKLTGKQFRLPTEAEWEYAARGGNRSRGYKYAGSNNLSEVAWFKDNFKDNKVNSGSLIHPVAQKQANELGLYDMSGNVWEWCSDWYGDYSSSLQHNPQGATSGNLRVLRGGAWFVDAEYCRVSSRGYWHHNDPILDPDVGLRLALSLEKSIRRHRLSDILSKWFRRV